MFMDKFRDFPQEPRVMSDTEGEHLFHQMLMQIEAFRPDQIIAVSRSGFSYGMWVAQILKLPLGAYWPKSNKIMFGTDSIPQKCVFVDDNILQGTTYRTTNVFMKNNYPNIEWRWAVLFSDWHTPADVRSEIIQGTRLPYFAEEPMWGSKKLSLGYGIRFRDEDCV